MLELINANKTKLTGAVLVTLSLAQATLPKDLLTPAAYAWTMFGIGLVVTFFGFLNNPSKEG